jgi:transcriptional regulator with XRE-family HTH domain
VSEITQIEQELLLLGRAIREIREQHGIAIGELAAGTGVDRARIEALEEARLDPDYELLLRLAEGIGVRVSTFVVRAEELVCLTVSPRRAR